MAGASVTYRQSSFLARLLPNDMLARQSSAFVPSPDDRHAIDRFCLDLFDGTRNLGAIAAELSTKFPNSFARDLDALDHAAKLANRYH